MGNVVDGVVEVKSDNFSGSVKVNGTWYAFARGLDNKSVNKGDFVSLTLTPWQAKGKSGFNISSFVVKDKPQELVKAPAQPKVEPNRPPQSAQKASLTEDQIRGQIRTHLVSSSMPILLTGAVDLEGSLEMINKLTDFVMKGKVE